MGVIVRQKVKGKGNPWWVFVAHNNKRISRMIGEKKAAEEVANKIQARLALGEFDIDEEKRDREKDRAHAQRVCGFLAEHYCAGDVQGVDR